MMIFRTTLLLLIAAFALHAEPLYLNLVTGKHRGTGTLETLVRGPFVQGRKSTMHVTAHLDMNNEPGNRTDVDVLTTRGTLRLEGGGMHELIHIFLAPDFKEKRHDHGTIQVGTRLPLLRAGQTYYGAWLERLPVVRDDSERRLHIDAQSFAADTTSGRRLVLKHFVITITPEKIHLRLVTVLVARNPFEEGDVTQTLALEFNPHP